MRLRIIKLVINGNDSLFFESDFAFQSAEKTSQKNSLPNGKCLEIVKGQNVQVNFMQFLRRSILAKR